jgi:hypothetical protein
MRKPWAAAGPLAAALLLAGTLTPDPALAATAGCQSWTGTQPVKVGSQSFLTGVTVLSACDVWAVGTSDDAQGVEHALTEHWNGASWTVVPVPGQGAAGSFLTGVRAASPTNIWAVGASGIGGSSPQKKTLILHWDGKRWSRQGTPVAGELSGVRAVSGSEVWAVGLNFTSTAVRPVVLHRTGGTWRGVTIPSVATNEELNGVAATSPADVWAVGASGTGIDSRHRRGVPSTSQPFIVHWNGRTWTHVTSPGTGELAAVGTGSRTSAMAVGSQPLPGGGTGTLAMRWNGKSWARVPSPSPAPALSDVLTGVTVTAQGTAWAVGKVQSTDNGDQALIERWDGSRWTTVPAPALGFGSGLFAVAASSASNVWAVGKTTGPSGGIPAALHCC